MPVLSLQVIEKELRNAICVPGIFTKEMKTCFLLVLAERTQWIVNPPHYSKMPVEGVMSSKEIVKSSQVAFNEKNHVNRTALQCGEKHT